MPPALCGCAVLAFLPPSEAFDLPLWLSSVKRIKVARQGGGLINASALASPAHSACSGYLLIVMAMGFQGPDLVPTRNTERRSVNA
jgi:hypothetical protein